MLFVSVVATATGGTNASETSGSGEASDLVGFFKQALSAPHDVERFVATEQRLRARGGLQDPPNTKYPTPPTWYEGARSGSNFFFRILEATNGVAEQGKSPLTVGRYGTNPYYLNANTVGRGAGSLESNRNTILISGSDSSFRHLNQCLNMGLSSLKPETVLWNGNEFYAEQVEGGAVYGVLELSGGKPSNLTIRSAKGAKPYLAFSYEYPDPAGSLRGFPARIIMSVLFKDGLHPWLEVRFLDVQMPKQPLSPQFFAEDRFLSRDIVYQNVFSNGIQYTMLPGGQWAPIPKQPVGGSFSRSRRLTILTALIVATIIFGWLIAKSEIHKRKAKT